MQSKLYVGNLNYTVSESDLYSLFQKYGEVVSVNLIKDKYTGQSKGFAFVEMGNAALAEKALAENGNALMGRNITVSEARPKKDFDDRSRGNQSHGRRGSRY